MSDGSVEIGEKSSKAPSLEPATISLEEAYLSPEPDVKIPDGGLKACLAILGGWLIQFCTFGNATSFGVYQDYYVQQGTATSSAISWIGSVQIALLFLVGIVSGRLFDKGYFHHVSIVGTLVFCFCLFMLSLADPTKYYQLILSQGIGMGFGGGLLMCLTVSMQAHHWDKHLCLAMGIVQAGSSCGGIVYPILVNQLFYGSTGFAWGVRASGFLSLGLLTIACCIMRTRLPKAKAGVNDQPSMKSILSDKPYMLMILGLSLVSLGIFFPWFYLQSWARIHNLPSELSFYTIAILNASSIPGRIIPSLMADHWGSLTVICPISVISSALIFAMFGTTTTGPVMVFTILYGFFTGAWLALIPVVLSSLAKSNREAGVRIGVGFFIISYPILTGTPINGALLGDNYQWYKTLLFSGILMSVGSVILIGTRQIVAKGKGTQKV